MGIALVVAISVAALHFSEAEEVVRIARNAQPWWVLLAVLLQLGTYVAQGEIWRSLGKAAGLQLSRGAVFRLSLAKLFIDQALPSAGLSGTGAVSKHLEQRGMAKPAVMATVVVNITSYFTTYVVLLMSALVLLPLSGAARTTVTLVSIVFTAASLTLVFALFVLPGRMGRVVERLARMHSLQTFARSLGEADTGLMRRPRLLMAACASQAAIILLDAATVWVLIEALGSHAPASAVFASFMFSNLFRTLGVLPGGLGTFEASSVLTLQLVGVPVPVALSATLLFRGLSFWLPMIPGMWLSHRLFGAASR